MTETPYDYPANARYAAESALIAAGLVDPDDGTVPRWRRGDPTPIWTNPMHVVDTVLAAALPHLGQAATYTAAEVKVLTEAALRLGRKEAGEEIAEALEGLDPKASTLACAFLARTLTSPTYSAEEAPRAVLMFSEDIDQDTAQAISDASSARTDLSVDTDLPQDPRDASNRLPGGEG